MTGRIILESINIEYHVITNVQLLYGVHLYCSVHQVSMSKGKFPLASKTFTFISLFTFWVVPVYRLRYNAISCILSICFDDAMHGRYASCFVSITQKSNLFGKLIWRREIISTVRNPWVFDTIYNKRQDIYSWALCLHNMKHISHLLHHQNKPTIRMG